LLLDLHRDLNLPLLHSGHLRTERVPFSSYGIHTHSQIRVPQSAHERANHLDQDVHPRSSGLPCNAVASAARGFVACPQRASASSVLEHVRNAYSMPIRRASIHSCLPELPADHWLKEPHLHPAPCMYIMYVCTNQSSGSSRPGQIWSQNQHAQESEYLAQRTSAEALGWYIGPGRLFGSHSHSVGGSTRPCGASIGDVLFLPPQQHTQSLR
jgi:hypothetical protein